MGGPEDALTKEQRRKARKEKKERKRKRAESDAAELPAKKRSKTDGDVKEKKEKRDKKEKKEKKSKKSKKGREEKNETAETGGEGLTVHLYRQHADARNATRKVVDAYRKEKDVYLSIAKEMDEEAEKAASEELTADPLWNPIQDFSHAKESFGEVLLNAACGGFEAPSPIQAQSWPVLLSGRDAVAIAATGSGKTLSFLLPALRHVLANGGAKNRNARVLVLAPTRELAIQSFEVSKVAGKAVGLQSACIYGGVAKYEQRQLLKRGVQLIIATPGRLLDLVDERNCDLSSVDYVILDEGDRMLDMGFEPDVTKILSLTKSRLQRQTVMFSATWPQVVQQLASKFLKTDAIKICIARDGNSHDMDQPQANRSITQHVELIEDHEKEQRLITLLRKYHKNNNRVLVFCLYKKEAARVHRLLQRRGFPKSGAIHGDMNQYARSEALAGFKDASHPILVATDVAARGLDIPDVEYVLNYTFPLTIEDYVHRIGRTGRGGKTGISHTLFTRGEKKLAGDLSVVLKAAGQHVPPEIEAFGPTIKRKKEHSMYGAHFRDDSRPMKAPTRVVFD